MSTSVSERERLEALASYGVLDTPPEEAFDRIARLMDACFDVPAATVAFVDADRTWGKAYTGFDPSIKREQSFCLHVVINDAPLVLENPKQDPRFADNPMVIGDPGVRFYAGVPVRTPEQIPIGTVCLYDTTPRSFSGEELNRLQDFAALVEDELEQSRAESATGTIQVDARLRADDPSARRRESETEEGILRLDADGHVEWANERFVEMAGYTLEELRGECPVTLLHGPATDEDEVDTIRDHIDRGEPFTTSIVHYRKSGAQYWVRIQGEPLIKSGDCTGFRLVLRDTTEARQKKDAMTALTSFYEQALRELPIDVAVMDPEGRYLFLNPAAVPDDALREWLIGKTAVDYAKKRGLDPAPFRERMEMVQRVAEQKETASMEDPVQTGDGDTRYMLRVAHPITDAEGEVVRVFGYGIDITDRKQREQRLVEAKDHAEEMNRLKTTFLANMSHEIRTPLTSIIGFAEVLVEEADGRQREMADLIHRSGGRLKQTLTSVLELARLEGDEKTLTPKRIDLVERIRDTAELLRPQIHESDVTLGIDLPEGPVEGRIDGTALDRVLTNLLTNAIKFTEKGDITVTLNAVPDTVELVVADTGIGIGDEFRQRIYQAFQQESSGTARTHDGIGLGLTITQQLVTLMEGSIDLESTKGEGTRVTVTFPRFVGADDSGKRVEVGSA